MFILRSIFWLAVAFLVIQPGGNGWQNQASALGDKAVKFGHSAASEQVAQISCSSLECFGTKAVITHSLSVTQPALATFNNPPPPGVSTDQKIICLAGVALLSPTLLKSRSCRAVTRCPVSRLFPFQCIAECARTG